MQPLYLYIAGIAPKNTILPNKSNLHIIIITYRTMPIGLNLFASEQ